MPLILPGNVGSATASTTYDVANSCRFNDGDSAYMTRAFDATQTSTSTFTISVWVKRGILGTRQSIFAAYDGSSEAGDDLEFETDDTLSYNGSGSSSSKLNTTSAVFRDPGAWYHIVVARNSGATGAANQVKIYVNGVLQTLGTNGGCDTSQFLKTGLNSRIGASQNGSAYYVDMYMAEFVAIDGQMLDHTSFGEFDSDSPTIWKPKDISGLTFGTNGFYLDFEDSGDLGDDESGNTNDFTETNLAAADQAVDSPTNNFCTLNPLNAATSVKFTYSEGNTKALSTGTWRGGSGTFGVSSGKWYWEVVGSGASTPSGVATAGYIASGSADQEHGYLGVATTEKSYTYHLNGKLYTVNTDGSQANTSYGDTYTTEVIGIALNLDDNELKFYKDNTVQNSGTAISIASGFTYMPIFHVADSANVSFNFGGSSGFAITSAASDADGYGNFEFAPPSGFFSLCTKNLAEYG
jgi:hypothetical protein